MKTEIAERIRMARLEKGLSQHNVAEDLGLSTSGYSNIERGKTNITIARLRQLAVILDKELNELLGLGRDNMVSESPIVYNNALSQQFLLLSNQMNALQFKLGQLEQDIRNLEARLG